MSFTETFLKTIFGAIICGIFLGVILDYSFRLLYLYNSIPEFLIWTFIPITLSIITLFIYSAIIRDDALRKTNIRIVFVATCYSSAALTLFVRILVHSF